MIGRRFIIQALGLAPVAVPSAAKALLKPSTLAALAATEAFPTDRDADGALVRRKLNPVQKLLAEEFRRADRMRDRFNHVARYNRRFDPDISGMKSWSHAYKVRQQFNRDISEADWFDEIRRKIWPQDKDE